MFTSYIGRERRELREDDAIGQTEKEGRKMDGAELAAVTPDGRRRRERKGGERREIGTEERE